MEHPPTANPPGLQLPTIGDNIANFNFGTPISADGTTKTEKFGLVSPEGGQFLYTTFASKTLSMEPPDRTLSEDLDNYFVCKLLITMKIQEVALTRYVYTVWAVGSNSAFKTPVLLADARVDPTGDDIANLVRCFVGYSYHSHQPICMPYGS